MKQNPKYMAKKAFVASMFDNIAPTYDKLNHILSLNIDKLWRMDAIDRLSKTQPKVVLDEACGTGDFSLLIARKCPDAKVIGVDISEGMMDIGRQKVAEQGLSERITMHVDDATQLQMEDNSVDAITVAFGVRNYEHLQKGLDEMCRVIRPGGHTFILELSVPQNKLLLWGYKLYFLHILPWIGGLISGNKEAYNYLPASVLNFPKPDVFLQMLKQAGFSDTRQIAYTFGLCRLFIGKK